MGFEFSATALLYFSVVNNQVKIKRWHFPSFLWTTALNCSAVMEIAWLVHRTVTLIEEVMCLHYPGHIVILLCVNDKGSNIHPASILSSYCFVQSENKLLTFPQTTSHLRTEGGACYNSTLLSLRPCLCNKISITDLKRGSKNKNCRYYFINNAVNILSA